MPSSAKSSDVQRHERVMVFIDGSNLYHVLGEVCGRHDLNFGKFSAKIAGDRDLVRTYYYNIRQDSERDPNVASEQGKFLQTMYDTPYLEVRMGVSKRHGETMVEKGVDVYMATDLVAFAFMDMYDTAIVVSGDGDFFPAIQTAKNQGKHIEVAAFDNNLSSEAANVADAVVKLNKTYFTGLWSDRRRRSSASSGTSSTRRTRTSRSSSSSRGASSSRAAAATAPEPDVTEEATTEESTRKTPTRRRATSTRSRSTTTRRRTPTRRTAASSPANDTTEAPSTPQPEATPEPAAASSNGNSSSDEESTPRTRVRRTPSRRRVGARSSASNGNGDAGTPTPPTPPALRRRAGSNGSDDESSD